MQVSMLVHGLEISVVSDNYSVWQLLLLSVP